MIHRLTARNRRNEGAPARPSCKAANVRIGAPVARPPIPWFFRRRRRPNLAHPAVFTSNRPGSDSPWLAGKRACLAEPARSGRNAIGSGAMAPPSRGTFNSTERDLGLDVPITRRDFLGGTLLAAGAGLLQLPPPQAPRASTLSAADWQGYGGIGDYASSNGNTWEAVTTAHRLRDRQLGGADAAKQAVDTGERYDLIVVGGGLSGLAAAFYFKKGNPGRCLVLDNHPIAGGEAKRNEFNIDGVHLIGPQGSNDFGTRLSAGWAGEYWQELGLP